MKLQQSLQPWGPVFPPAPPDLCRFKFSGSRNLHESFLSQTAFRHVSATGTQAQWLQAAGTWGEIVISVVPHIGSPSSPDRGHVLLWNDTIP